MTTIRSLVTSAQLNDVAHSARLLRETLLCTRAELEALVSRAKEYDLRTDTEGNEIDWLLSLEKSATIAKCDALKAEALQDIGSDSKKPTNRVSGFFNWMSKVTS